ncbi:MAG: formate dehydrogenase accessory sulfurtransferase FdhD [Polyangiaceae bacterium]
MSDPGGAPVVGFRGSARAETTDRIAIEEPLEIQVQGASVAVLMRTPGDDLDLARGFLLTEGIVSSAADIASMRHCSSVKDPDAEENILRVVLREGVEVPLSLLRRNTFASSSCGLCGKATIASTLVRAAPIPLDRGSVSLGVLYGLPDKLRAAQRAFDATGGVHGAALFEPDGALTVLREDVGRHNAVDKVIGHRATARASGEEILLVSGRTSFEITQKAAVAGIPIVVGISAPTTLAVAFADAAGVTLAGFLRGETVNAYTHAHRLVP